MSVLDSVNGWGWRDGTVCHMLHCRMTADSTTSVRVWWDTAWWDTAENEGTFSNQHKSL